MIRRSIRRLSSTRLPSCLAFLFLPAVSFAFLSFFSSFKVRQDVLQLINLYFTFANMNFVGYKESMATLAGCWEAITGLLICLCTSQIEASTSPPPRATPRAFEFFENLCSNSPLPGLKSSSNAPTRSCLRGSSGDLFHSERPVIPPRKLLFIL